MHRTYSSVVLTFVAIGIGYGQTGAPVKMTLQDAEALALKNHPQVLAAQSMVAAIGRQVVEAKSSYYPTVAGDFTGSGANQQARIGAGFLTDSRIFNRVGQGITVNQLITDSGRTNNLVASARLQADAAQQTYAATRYDVLLRVNQAYYNVLRAEQTIKVAQATVEARQQVADQINELARNNLRSQLDVQFADVNVSKAKLMLLQAQDLQQQTFAEFTRALGAQQNTAYQLADQPLPPGPPPNAEQLVAQAIGARPELAGLRLNRDAANKFERAEHDLKYPTVSLVGMGGYIDYINQITLPRVIPNEYAGAAVDVHIPIFNGRLFTAREQEAHDRAMEADQRLRNEEQIVARDVRTAYADATTAYQRIAVTAQMLREATQATSLAQGRYDNRLASIVELTDAQLNETAAQIENVNAQYDYQIQYAVLQYALGALR